MALLSSWRGVCFWGARLLDERRLRSRAAAVPGVQVQEVDIHGHDLPGSGPGQRIHGAPLGELQWRLLPSDRQELQPFLQRRLLQADREQDPEVGQSAREDRYGPSGLASS